MLAVMPGDMKHSQISGKLLNISGPVFLMEKRNFYLVFLHVELCGHILRSPGGLKQFYFFFLLP